MSTALKTAAKTFAPINRAQGYRFTSVTRSTQEMAELRHEISRLETLLASQAATIETLRNQATTDSLTGLLNRRGFEAALGTVLADHLRYGYSAALLNIDVNHFKAINDAYGHVAGDMVLRHIASLLEQHTRATDVRARTGGDEFLLVLKENAAATANAKAHALAELIDETPCYIKGVRLPVSVSIGVATVTESHETAALLALADQRMYAAKRLAHAATR